MLSSLFSPLKSFFPCLVLRLVRGEELPIQDTVEGVSSACKAQVQVWIVLSKDPHVLHGQVLPPTICCTVVCSEAYGTLQTLSAFMNLICISVCWVQQELNRFFIAGDFWYQIRQMSVGCRESCPQENNRPMIPEESSSLPFCFFFGWLLKRVKSGGKRR